MREKAARDQLEDLLEDQTRKLFCANQELKEKLSLLKSQQVTIIQTDKMATHGTLSAGEAHEINNPINYVKTSIKPLKDNLAEILELVDEYAQNLEKIGDKDIEQLINCLTVKVDFTAKLPPVPCSAVFYLISCLSFFHPQMFLRVVCMSICMPALLRKNAGGN